MTSDIREVPSVCVENSCRSVMAEAWFKATVEPDTAGAPSAGTPPAEDVNPLARNVIEELFRSL